MGYYVKKFTSKGGKGWKLQLISYAKVDTSKRPRKTRDVPKRDWVAHGFNPSLSLPEARAMAKTLNTTAEQNRWAEAKLRIRERLASEDDVECSFLPEIFVKGFEREILFEKLARADVSVSRRNKTQSHWRAAKRVIRQIKLAPEDWYDKAHLFFNYFSKVHWSPSYVQKILRLLNQWAFYFSKRQGRAFLPIPAPRGAEAQRIADSYFDGSRSGEGQKSAPLSPEVLFAAKSKLSDANYNWLLLSVYFGLRPSEIDGLHRSNTWKVESTSKDKKVLLVYQSKLRTVARPQRWKKIPALLPEQFETLKLLESKELNLKRPTYKTMHSKFGRSITLYGGRKNFADMFLNKGYRLEQISQWLGHTTLDRTFRDYKNRLLLNLEGFDDKAS